MCGLTGVVTTAFANGPTLNIAELDALFDGIGALSLGEDAGNLDDVEERVEELFLFQNFLEALRTPRWSRVAGRGARVLGTCARRYEKARDAAVHVGDQERLAAAAIRCRDLAWRLERDFLPNLEKVRQLAESGKPVSRRHAFLLWQLNTLLNGIDRLEVRGRDSAGLAVHLFFPGPEALSAFVARPDIVPLIDPRERAGALASGVVRRAVSTGEQPDCLLFVYKVANEIGEMGENVSRLRAQIQADALFHAALEVDGVRGQPFGHTRWASNGIISEANCHPLDNARLGIDGAAFAPPHTILAALNGDIDNYQEIKEELAAAGRRIPANVTTDAKVIPLKIDHNLALGMTFEEAFRRAVAAFQGSMAIVVQTSLRPGKTFLALRGSGQSIYIGVTRHGFLYASELYGVVEETQRFIKMDGEKERTPGDATSTGQIAILDAGWQDGASPSADLVCYDGTPIPPSDRTTHTAEITTRDIDRAGYPHFMLKEISESVASVRKTIRGKFFANQQQVRFPLLDEIMPPGLLERLQGGDIHRILCVGQGTAAVAAQGIAELMRHVLRDAAIEVSATKATELSGFRMRPLMDDTLVIAVSQSGTTTDTNRTVDVVKGRGAAVLAIVNRRNSDLVFKADAVFYTSDGRDVEMSVASTKAFYAQVSAGYLLALAFADRLGLVGDDAIRNDLRTLERLPSLISQVLDNAESIEALAERWAVRKRYWAVVGNGSGRVAASEIRIKLSELCYKAIAFDITEDKKHIDLSSEPLVIVCAVGLTPSNLRDVVKEVAIFKAHKACPLVIAEAGQEQFEPYAAGVMYVPRGAGRLAFVLATVAGHLWGYYAARALDDQAGMLRRLRASSVAVYERLDGHRGGVAREVLAAALRAEVGREISRLQSWLMTGRLDSGLTAATAIRLLTMTQAVTGRVPLDDVVHHFGGTGPVGSSELFTAYIEALTGAINDLTRPIDAIKHQAKTVTVGISRAAQPAGVLFEALAEAGVPADALLPSHVEVLEALSPLVSSVSGSIRYRLEGLTEVGEPGPDTHIRVLEKTGLALDIPSRAAGGTPLVGTKWLSATQRWVFAGVGSSDGRHIVLFPLFDGSGLSGMLLLHVRFRQAAPARDRVRALRAYRNRYEWLVGSVTELNIPWDDKLLERIPIELMFEGSADAIAKHVRGAPGQESAEVV